MNMEGKGALSGREVGIELTQERVGGVTVKSSHPKKVRKCKVSRVLYLKAKELNT
jgi:hypothetical protein